MDKIDLLIIYCLTGLAGFSIIGFLSYHFLFKDILERGKNKEDD
ncbi:hypothetical protein OAP14_02510 [Aliiglaciecola sp.]|nr:hypothetical protein [Aliiglaciecola sp.]